MLMLWIGSKVWNQSFKEENPPKGGEQAHDLFLPQIYPLQVISFSSRAPFVLADAKQLLLPYLWVGSYIIVKSYMRDVHISYLSGAISRVYME